MDPALWEFLRRSTDRDMEAIIRLDRPHVGVAGVRVVSRFGCIATCRLPKDSILDVRRNENVVSLKAARSLGPEYEKQNRGTARELSRPGGDRRRPPGLPLTGAGVTVGFVDWGCDFDHPNFTRPDGSTRLRALWDQRGAAASGSPQPYGYGVVHGRRQIDQALRAADPYATLGYHPGDADRNSSGAHGTHVMDIAAGNGLAGSPSGIAPGADLVFVHLADRGTSGLANLGDSVRILEAVDFIARTAGPRPWVINISVGRHGGPHDGCTLVELAFDSLLKEAPGRFIVQSAGNYFGARTHASGLLNEAQVRSLTVMTLEADVTPNELEVWYSGEDELAVQVASPTGQQTRWVPLSEQADITEDDRVVGRIYHRDCDPNNHDNHIDLFLDPWAPAGPWRVSLRAIRIRHGVFHAWIERDEACADCQARFVEADADSACTTGTIANAHLPLVVGAYDAHSPTRAVAAFSSDGPTRDGRFKPDLVAPGMQILAARSAPPGSVSSLGLLTIKSGTSMAAPHVTGAVALCLQGAPSPLAAWEIRELLLRTAGPLTGAEPSSRYGYGYLDVASVVRAVSALGRRVTPRRPNVPAGARRSGRNPKETNMDLELNEVIPAYLSPGMLYRELLYHPGGPVSAWIDATFEVIARPGESPLAQPEAGDVLVRVALGEPGLGHVAVISDSGLRPRSSLDPAYIRSERGGPGMYATVIEGGAFPHALSDRFARRVLDQAGHIPPGQLLLRPKPTSGLDLESSDAPSQVIGRSASSPRKETRHRVAAGLTRCEQARTQAQAHDAASARLIELLNRPISSYDRAELALRMQQMTGLFQSLSSDQKAVLRARLNDPADALGRLFDCELHHVSRDRLRKLLEQLPNPVPTTPQKAPVLDRCRREMGTITSLLPWERYFLGLVNSRTEDQFESVALIMGPIFHPAISTSFHRLIVPIALKGSVAITIESNIWFRDTLDTSQVEDLGTLVHESVHVLDYALVGADAFLKSYVMKAVVARFDHDKIPDERRAIRMERATLRMLGRFPALVELIKTCDNDAILADLQHSRDVYHASLVDFLTDYRSVGDMEAQVSPGLVDLIDMSGSVGGDSWEVGGHLDLGGGARDGDVEYNVILDRIRQELSQRFTDAADPELSRRRQRLRRLFARVPRSHARELHDRLGDRPTKDELSRLFHGRLARATRSELRRILQDRFLEDENPRGREQPGTIPTPGWALAPPSPPPVSDGPRSTQTGPDLPPKNWFERLPPLPGPGPEFPVGKLLDHARKVLEALQAAGQTGEIVAGLAATIGVVVAALVTFDSLGVAGYLVFDVSTGSLSLVPLEENAHISMVQRYGRAQMAPDWQQLEDALQRLHRLDERGIGQLVEHQQSAFTQSAPPVLLEPTVTTEPFQRGFVRFQLVGNAGDFAALNSADAGAQVYVFRDAQGRAIYVGYTERSSVVRLGEHLAKDKPGEFLGEASFIEIKGKGLLEREARALEQDLIQELKPKWNSELVPYSDKYDGALPSSDEIRRANNTLIRIGIKFAD